MSKIARIYQNMDSPSDPLVPLEAYCELQGWEYDRERADILSTVMPGRYADYAVSFLYHDEPEMVQFFCQLCDPIEEEQHEKIRELMTLINETLWLGHFDMPSADPAVIFRHAVLLRDTLEGGLMQIADILAIAAAECDRFYPAFDMVLGGDFTPRQAVDMCLIVPNGSA